MLFTTGQVMSVTKKTQPDLNGLTPHVVHFTHALSLGSSGSSGTHADRTGLGTCFHDFYSNSKGARSKLCPGS